MAQAITLRTMLGDLRAISHERAALQKQLASLLGEKTDEAKAMRRRLHMRITAANSRVEALERHVREHHQQGARSQWDRWSV